VPGVPLGEEAAVGRLVHSLESRRAGGARVAIVLGSGLSALADRLDNAVAIPFLELEGMPTATTTGHAGRFIIGELGGERVIVQQGRVHLYEGRTPTEVARSARVLARMGCQALVLTNAAGGLRREWNPPCLMRIEDHLNLQGSSPLAHRETATGTIYDPEIGAVLDRTARDAGLRLESGIYAGIRGPSYETPAEIRMLAWMGADAVGMSTVIEAQAGRAAGMRVAGVSCITNHAAGISPRRLSHEEVLEAGASAAGSVATLVERSIPGLLRALLPR